MRYLLLLIGYLTSFFPQEDRGYFFDQVLSLDKGHDAYLCVTIQARDSTAQTVIQNQDLYYHFRSEQKCRSVADYQAQVKQALLEDQAITLSHNLAIYHVARLKKCPQSSMYSSVSDLNRYFSNSGFIKEGYQSITPCLIRDLFEQDIATAIDPKSGYLYYFRP